MEKKRVQGRLVILLEPEGRKAGTFPTYFSVKLWPLEAAGIHILLVNVGQVQIHVPIRNASTCTNSFSLLRFASQFLWYMLTLAAHLSSSLW